MPTPAYHAIVTAEGHLVDSQLLNSIFDRVIERGADFEVQHFDLGRTNDDFSKLTLKITSADPAALAGLLEDLVPFGCHAIGEQDALVRAVDRDGCAPEDFYSSTNQRTQVRAGGKWIDVERQRMDAAIVVSGASAMCRKLRELRVGDEVVCGLDGLRVTPERAEQLAKALADVVESWDEDDEAPDGADFIIQLHAFPRPGTLTPAEAPDTRNNPEEQS